MGFDCYQKCPEEWRDDGQFCKKPGYDRGKGYDWKIGDRIG